MTVCKSAKEVTVLSQIAVILRKNVTLVKHELQNICFMTLNVHKKLDYM